MSEATAIAPAPLEFDEVALSATIELWDDPAARRRRARERRLAHDLVELSRLDRGLERAEPAPVDLARLLPRGHGRLPGPLARGSLCREDRDRFAAPRARALHPSRQRPDPRRAPGHGALRRARHQRVRRRSRLPGERPGPRGGAVRHRPWDRRPRRRPGIRRLRAARRSCWAQGCSIGNGERGGATVAVHFAGAIPTAE